MWLKNMVKEDNAPNSVACIQISLLPSITSVRGATFLIALNLSFCICKMGTKIVLQIYRDLPHVGPMLSAQYMLAFIILTDLDASKT